MQTDIYKVILNNDLGLPVKVLFSGDREQAINLFDDKIRTCNVVLMTGDVIIGEFDPKQDKIEPEK
jgi:hypothetical protein